MENPSTVHTTLDPNSGVIVHYDGYAEHMVPSILKQWEACGGDLNFFHQRCITIPYQGWSQFGKVALTEGPPANSNPWGEFEGWTEYAYMVSDKGIEVWPRYGQRFFLTWDELEDFRTRDRWGELWDMGREFEGEEGNPD